MAFRLVVLAAALACANAGLTPVAAPLAYSPASAVSSAYINTIAAPVAHATYAAPVAHAYSAPVAAVHDPHYAATSQSVVRSALGGTVSHYNKAVDGAFSSVRKYDTRITNDAYAYATPVVAKAAYAAPVATYAHATPVASYAAPVIAKTAYAAPIAHYAAAPVVAKTYAAAPVATYAAPVIAKAAYAAPVAHYAAAPVVTKSYAAAPVVAKAALTYSPAVAVSHMTFAGPFATYQW